MCSNCSGDYENPDATAREQKDEPMRIITEHVNPPIPVRFWDWRAYVEGQEENRELYGWGANETAAVADLVDILEGTCDSAEEFKKVEQAHKEYWARKEKV